jgi:hypothetical protein
VLPFVSLSGVLRRPPGKKGMEAGFRAALLAMTEEGWGTGRQTTVSESILLVSHNGERIYARTVISSPERCNQVESMQAAAD